MSCLVFFEALPSGEAVGQRASLIDQAHPQGICQGETVSAHSAGPVRDDEYIFRFVFSPIHLDDDGSIKAAAFSDVSDKGLSCQRGPSSTPPQDVHQRGTTQAAAFNAEPANSGKDRRAYLGVVWASSSEVRAVSYEDGTGAFAIYDTARADNPEHVDVFQTFNGTRQSEQKRRRKELRDKFTRVPTPPPTPAE